MYLRDASLTQCGPTQEGHARSCRAQAAGGCSERRQQGATAGGGKAQCMRHKLAGTITPHTREADAVSVKLALRSDIIWRAQHCQATRCDALTTPSPLTRPCTLHKLTLTITRFLGLLVADESHTRHVASYVPTFYKARPSAPSRAPHLGGSVFSAGTHYLRRCGGT
jgi:hypothetical protein